MSGKNLISENTAKQIVDLLLRQAGENHRLAASLSVQTSREEFSDYSIIIGAVMVAIYEEGLKPLFKLYPHLKPDEFP